MVGAGHGDRRRAVAFGLAAALVGWSLLANLVIGDVGYVTRNLVLTALALEAARRAGFGWTDLGLGPRAWRAGLWWGLAAMAVVAAVLVVGVLLADRVPPVAALLDDERARLPAERLAFVALVRIPFGTALFEEVVFRGLLLAAWLRITSTARAVWWSSAVFGVWHVAPTMVALELNGVDPLSGAGAGAVLGAVAITTVAGIGFTWLRLRSGSLLAPILAHIATNSFALLAAAAANGVSPPAG